MPQPLTTQEVSLIAAAKTTIDGVPSGTLERPNEDHTVASAVLCSNGQIYTGINLYHFTGGPCAEVVAFANAAAAGVVSGSSPGVASSGLVSGIDVDGGKVRVVSVVAVAKGERGVISPCGRCRQVMLDYHPWIRVILRTGEGVGEEGLETVGLGELLPFAYVSID